MKLFFDENLSPRLIDLLADEYPRSADVRNRNLRGAADIQIWNYCKQNNFIIVSNLDYSQRNLILCKAE